MAKDSISVACPAPSVGEYAQKIPPPSCALQFYGVRYERQQFLRSLRVASLRRFQEMWVTSLNESEAYPKKTFMTARPARTRASKLAKNWPSTFPWFL